MSKVIFKEFSDEPKVRYTINLTPEAKDIMLPALAQLIDRSCSVVLELLIREAYASNFEVDD